MIKFVEDQFLDYLFESEEKFLKALGAQSINYQLSVEDPLLLTDICVDFKNNPEVKNEDT